MIVVSVKNNQQVDSSESSTIEAQIKKHLLDGGVDWIKFQELLQENELSCIDGREKRAVIGTPGGDAGLLITILAVLEKQLKKELTDQEVKLFFQIYIEKFGRFYMHTDDHALFDLAKALVDRPEFQNANLNLNDEQQASQQMLKLIRFPEANQKALLLEELKKPEYMGCGHLRLSVKFADDYQVRPELINNFLEAYYDELWSQDTQADLYSLPGEHEENLILVVHTEGEIDHDTQIPAVRPLNPQTSGDGQPDEFFIVHPEVKKAMIAEVVRVLFGENSQLASKEFSGLDIESFLAEVEALGSHQLGQTKTHLADDKNIWHVVVSQGENGQVVATQPTTDY